MGCFIVKTKRADNFGKHSINSHTSGRKFIGSMMDFGARRWPHFCFSVNNIAKLLFYGQPA